MRHVATALGAGTKNSSVAVENPNHPSARSNNGDGVEQNYRSDWEKVFWTASGRHRRMKKIYWNHWWCTRILPIRVGLKVESCLVGIRSVLLRKDFCHCSYVPGGFNGSSAYVLFMYTIKTFLLYMKTVQSCVWFDRFFCMATDLVQ